MKAIQNFKESDHVILSGGKRYEIRAIRESEVVLAVPEQEKACLSMTHQRFLDRVYCKVLSNGKCEFC